MQTYGNTDNPWPSRCYPNTQSLGPLLALVACRSTLPIAEETRPDMDRAVVGFLRMNADYGAQSAKRGRPGGGVLTTNGFGLDDRESYAWPWLSALVTSERASQESPCRDSCCYCHWVNAVTAPSDVPRLDSIPFSTPSAPIQSTPTPSSCPWQESRDPPGRPVACNPWCVPDRPVYRDNLSSANDVVTSSA